MAASVRQKLERLIDLTGFSLVQENGQRRYGPRPGAPPPPRGSELFITNFPRDCYEDELIPVFAKVAPIYEMRLLMDFSGTNRGFAFLSYDSPEIAEAAIQFLHGYYIRPGHRMAVVRSVDNRRLYIGDLPREATGEELRTVLEQHTGESTIVELDMYQQCHNGARNRGFAFVEFESHRHASLARRKLVGQLRLNGHALQVDWAEPEPYVPAHIMKTVMALYVRNLPATTTPEVIEELFQSATKTRVERVKKIKDYAFVHFYTRKDAERALRKLQQTTLQGRQLQVKWAKPAAHLVQVGRRATQNRPILKECWPHNNKEPRKPSPQDCGSHRPEATVSQQLCPTERADCENPPIERQYLSPAVQELSPTVQELSPFVHELSPIDKELGAFSVESILDVQKEIKTVVSPWTGPPVHFYSAGLGCAVSQFHTEDFRLAPNKLKALCLRVGWEAPVYIMRRMGAYLLAVLQLQWPRGQVVYLHDPRLCSSWEAARALAAENGINFLQSIVAPNAGYTKPWTPIQQDPAAVDSGRDVRFASRALAVQK